VIATAVCVGAAWALGVGDRSAVDDTAVVDVVETSVLGSEDVADESDGAGGADETTGVGATAVTADAVDPQAASSGIPPAPASTNRLTIVRELVAAHGGSVRAESAGAGQGSTFTVLLPAAAEGREGDGPPLLSRDEEPGR
jgi:hypothetical protein